MEGTTARAGSTFRARARVIVARDDAYPPSIARSADAATLVLDSLEVLHGLSADGDVPDDAAVIAALESVGVHGFTEDHAGYLAMTGIMLRLMLRHSDVSAETLFNAAREDLRIIGDDIDEQAFDDIVGRFDEVD